MKRKNTPPNTEFQRLTSQKNEWNKKYLLGVYLNDENSGVCCEYAHVVSLGHACAVASELERFGLRDHSGPFDWQGTSLLQSRMNCLKDGFTNFMKQLIPEALYQRQVLSCYYMKEMGIFLVHDFNEWDSVENQLPRVKRKYESRINHFLHDISEPTLFMYYLCAENDVKYINSNIHEILAYIKAFNPYNDIVFIADEKYRINVPCFYVKNDPNSDIAKRFSDQNKELYDFIEAIPYSEKKKERNIEFYNAKQKKGLFYNMKKKVIRKWYLCTKGTYHHYLTFFD